LELCSRQLQLAALQVEAAAKVSFVCPLIHLATRVQAASLAALEIGLDGVGDGEGDLPLQVRQLAEATLIVSREEESAVRGVEESHVYSYAIARRPNRALHDGFDAKLPRDLGQRPPRSLGRGPRGARDDLQRADLSQIGDEPVGHPVRQV